MEELSKKKLAALDELFEDFQTVNHQIAEKTYEIDHPWTPSDQNIGGGRLSAISRPQEAILQRRESNKRLQYLISLRDDCNRAIARFDNEQRQIFDLRYCSSNYYDWDTVGNIIGYAHSQIYRKRYAMLWLLAEERGMVSHKDGTRNAISPSPKKL